jgi:hypothetical protein
MAGSSYEERRYMKLYTWLPAAIRPELRSALLISFGCGQTARSLVDTPELEAIHVVDISADVLDMNEAVFPDPDRQPLRDPRVQVHIEDGRYFLASTRVRFDLITSEPPPPPAVGVVNLYTREYFQLLHGALTEKGIVTYWLPIHDLSDRSSLAIIRGFCDVFDDCSLWRGQNSNLMMVGSRGTLDRVDRATFERIWSERPDADELLTLGFEHPAQIGALYLGGPAWLDEITEGTPALVDDDPAVIHAGFDGPPIEVAPGETMKSQLFSDWMNPGEAALRRWEEDPWPLFPEELAIEARSWFWVQDVLDDLEGARSVDLADIERIAIETELQYPLLLWAGSEPDRVAAAMRLYAAGDRHPEVMFNVGLHHLVQRDTDAASAALDQAEDENIERVRALIAAMVAAKPPPPETAEVPE